MHISLTHRSMIPDKNNCLSRQKKYPNDSWQIKLSFTTKKLFAINISEKIKFLCLSRRNLRTNSFIDVLRFRWRFLQNQKIPISNDNEKINEWKFWKCEIQTRNCLVHINVLSHFAAWQCFLKISGSQISPWHTCIYTIYTPPHHKIFTGSFFVAENNRFSVLFFDFKLKPKTRK